MCNTLRVIHHHHHQQQQQQHHHHHHHHHTRFLFNQTIFRSYSRSGYSWSGRSSKVYTANRHQLIVPRCRLSIYSRRAFSIAGPTVWNSLPDELIDPARSFDSFRQFLKTVLFSLY